MVNGSLNPLVNGSLNPHVNGSLNPLVNGSLNPTVNGSVNYLVNGSINPQTNGSINPLVNGSLNPSINGAFSSRIAFDLRLKPIGIAVDGPNGVLVLFDESRLQAVGSHGVTEFRVSVEGNPFMVGMNTSALRSPHGYITKLIG